MVSAAKTVDEYLRELPDGRREAIQAIRDVILGNLPAGYKEGMMYGMIGYFLPVDVLPVKSGPPVAYISLASQKNNLALYLGCQSSERIDRFREAYRATGKKVDMGKGCFRFKRLDDLPLDLVAEFVASCPLEQFVLEYKPGC